MWIPNSVEFGVYLCGCVSDRCRHRCQREIRLEGWVLSHMACGRATMNSGWPDRGGRRTGASAKRVTAAQASDQ
jgi:hypothetical protein